MSCIFVRSETFQTTLVCFQEWIIVHGTVLQNNLISIFRLKCNLKYVYRYSFKIGLRSNFSGVILVHVIIVLTVQDFDDFPKEFVD